MLWRECDLFVRSFDDFVLEIVDPVGRRQEVLHPAIGRLGDHVCESVLCSVNVLDGNLMMCHFLGGQ